MKTSDHFSSNWISWARGGKGHELVVASSGVAAGQSAGADRGVGGHADESGGGPHAVAIGDVPEHRGGLVLRPLRADQGRPLAFGGPRAAGAAVEQADVLVLAVAGADRQVAEATPAMIGTAVVLTAGAGKILIHDNTSLAQQKRGELRKSIEDQGLTDFNNLETPPRSQLREIDANPRRLKAAPSSIMASVYGLRIGCSFAASEGGAVRARDRDGILLADRDPGVDRDRLARVFRGGPLGPADQERCD